MSRKNSTQPKKKPAMSRKNSTQPKKKSKKKKSAFTNEDDEE